MVGLRRDPGTSEAAIRGDETLQILDELVDVRVALESAMAGAAARSIADADLAELAQLLEEMASQLHDAEPYLATEPDTTT